MQEKRRLDRIRIMKYKILSSCYKVWCYIKEALDWLNPFGEDESTQKILNEVDALKAKLIRLHESYEWFLTEIRYTREENTRLKNSISAFGDVLPDMVWMKDTEGRYLYANYAIINGLLFSKSLENTVGKTDSFHATNRKREVGNMNHTFGELCANSDLVVIQEGRPMKFLEYGKVTPIGKDTPVDLYLEVHKNVVRDDDGNIIATVGIGRDVTEYHQALVGLAAELENQSCTKCAVLNKIMPIIDMYRFEGCTI